MAFDPKTLIASDAEIREVSTDTARRRVAFTSFWLSESGFEAALQAIDVDRPADWSASGIDPKHLADLKASGFSAKQYHRVFANPKHVKDSPEILFYYRRLLSMGNKAFVRLFPALSIYQTRGGKLTTAQLDELQTMNGMLAGVMSGAQLTPEDPARLVVLSEGAAIDGDWRNQIGRIATWRTFEAMLSSLKPGELTRATFVKPRTPSMRVDALTLAQRSALIDERWKPDELDVGDCRIRFGSQPIGAQRVNADITVVKLAHKKPSAIVAAGEVKGSTDPANAMERWRLAANNIEAMHRIRAPRRPTTFYVGLVVTEPVIEGAGDYVGMKKLLDDRVLDEAFSLVKFANVTEQGRFSDFFRDQLGI